MNIIKSDFLWLLNSTFSVPDLYEKVLGDYDTDASSLINCEL
jgi:hypothetical protein